nr:MAG TPA: Endodeoxyribonuclease RusA [Caudoviricetes sp.]
MTPDADNIAKAVLDGLNGVVYADDKQIVELKVIKAYAEVPRVEVTIEEI